VQNLRSPVWNENFIFSIQTSDASEEVRIEVYRNNSAEGDFLVDAFSF